MKKRWLIIMTIIIPILIWIIRLFWVYGPENEKFLSADYMIAMLIDSGLARTLESVIFVVAFIVEAFFSVRLPMYIFFLFLLIAIFMKWRYKRLKKRKLIISCIIISGLNWIILYSTHSPSEKVYSVDSQYSYYFEEYNYNVIRKIVTPSFFYRTDYKIFIYDEVKRKVIKSKYFGQYSKNDICFEENRLCLGKPDYYKLPRPINK